MVGAEEDLIAEKNGTVGWIHGVMMPFTPPTSTSITGGPIVGMAAKEVNRKSAAGTAVNRGRVGEAARSRLTETRYQRGQRVPSGR
jgi:hypothetical protein